MTPTASPAGPPAPGGTGRPQWTAAVRELVRLRREEADSEEATEDATADELRRVFRDHQPHTAAASHDQLDRSPGMSPAL